MSLRNILLHASLGAMTTASAEQTSYKQARSDEPNVVTHTLYMTQNRSRYEQFAQNYRYLYSNVDANYFSFGDKRELRRCLERVGSCAMGQEIIAGIPANMQFGSAEMPKGYGGGYDWRHNRLMIDTETLDENGEHYDKRTDVLFHELLHAYQKENGIMLMDNPSIEQSLLSQKLIEAEARAWSDVVGTTRILSESLPPHNNNPSKPYNLTPEQITAFMQRDLVAEYRQDAQRNNDSFDEADFRRINPSYRFQQALIACDGSCAAAQRKMVAERIVHYMQDRDRSWSAKYNAQAIQATAILCDEGRISRRGNAQAYNNMLQYYQRNYGISPSRITNTHFSSQEQDTINLIRNYMNRNNAYSDARQESGAGQRLEVARRNNQGR